MSAQSAIDLLRSKEGIPNSITPTFHANTLQALLNELSTPSAINDFLRGAVEPDAFLQSETYDKLDRVKVGNLSWVAIRPVLSGRPWDSRDWLEASIFGTVEHTLRIDEEQVALHDDIDVMRGAESYQKYMPMGKSYHKGEFVHEPSTGKDWSAREAITSDAGAFDPKLWWEASVQSVTKAANVVLLLQSLLNDERLDASAIKNLPTGGSADTAEQIVTKLQTLTGIARLDASAIQNLPNANYDLNSVRGDSGKSNYPEYNQTSGVYDIGDLVFVTSLNKRFLCHTPIPFPSTFDREHWIELSLLGLAKLSTNVSVYVTPHTVSYYSDFSDGFLSPQGWNSTQGNNITLVDGQYKYPRLLKLEDKETGSSVQMDHAITDGLAASMRSKGFTWEFATRIDSGYVYHYMQFTTAFNGTAGRFLLGMERIGVDLHISVDGGTVQVPANEFHTFTLSALPNENVAHLRIDGVYAGSVTYSSHSVTSSAILHTSGSSASTDEVFWMISSNLISFDTNSINLTRAQINENITYVIPHSSQDMSVYIPRGTYPIGAKFTLINGTTQPCRVSAELGDLQMFGRDTKFYLQPYQKSVFTQVAHSRGNTWSVDQHNAVDTDSKGYWIEVVLDATGSIRARHGNYHAMEALTSTKVATGHYQLAIARELVDGRWANTATAIGHNPRMTACVVDGGGVAVRTWDATGTPIDNGVTVTLSW